jgi:hypothetical protein
VRDKVKRHDDFGNQMFWKKTEQKQQEELQQKFDELPPVDVSDLPF